MTGKTKPRVSQKGKKGKRWKKGKSSESNPTLRKHREAAKNRFFNVQKGPSGLTVDALAKHDAAQDTGEIPMSEGASDTQSMAKTFNTWATNWTECTNATFGKVHRYWTSNSAQHKEILAVLAAVTEVIKEKDGKESETDYFAALMTTLETTEDEQSLAAVGYLLGLVIKKVPATVLKSRFSEVSKCFLNVLSTHANSEGCSLLKSMLMCLGQLLRVQEQALWTNSSTLHIYNSLLAFTVHPKPKVRKEAQDAVRVVLRASSFMLTEEAPPYHPATSATAKYCIQQIETSGGSAESTDTFHTLGLLQHILGYFPVNSLKATCETILRVMTLANVMVTSVAMKTLHGMFLSLPKSTSLSAELNAQIITALYDYQPGESDSQPMAAWLAVMERAHCNLHRLNEQLCLSHLARLFAVCMKCLLSEKRDVCQLATNTLLTLLKEVVSPSVELLDTLHRQSGGVASQSLAVKLVKYVEAGLSYQYHAAWDLVLQLIAAVFQVLGKPCADVMKKCLVSMAELRDSHKFAFTTELDQAVGAAVKAMGPRRVLDAVPLQITGDEDSFDFPRSWLLPVLRVSVQETELAFFTTYFLPLAAKLRIKSIEYAQQNATVQSKTYDTLQQQIWSLLVGFCNRPTDLMESFKGVARILGSALTDRPDLQMNVLTSLRRLISHNLDHEENRKELSRFAKNFLPILFNLYTTDFGKSSKDTKRLAVLETIKCYLQISDSQQLIPSFYEKCMGKLEETDLSAFRRHALMDIAMCLIPYIDEERLSKVYRLVNSQLKSADKTVQKKSYRILEEICSCPSEECKRFIKSSLTELQELFVKSLSTSSPSSKAPRLRCLIHIFRQLDEEQPEFLAAVVPEALLCTRELAERARTAAYNLLVEMGRTSQRWAKTREPVDGQEDPLMQYFELVLAGLAGNPHVVACTVLGITKLIYEFRASMETELLTVLVESTCLLLTSNSREVVGSSLGLIKVLLAVLPGEQLAQHMDTMVSSLVLMKEDSRRHYRFKTKDIFTRLLRKFGFEVIHSMVPESYHKVLQNIRKTSERAKKKKHQQDSASESDDNEGQGGFATKVKVETIDDLLKDSDSEAEGDELNKVKSKKSVRKKGGAAAWIKEDEGDIVDFMDPTVAKKLLATRPEDNVSMKQKIKHEFKKAPDGRLIIKEEEAADSANKRVVGKPGTMEVELDELLESLEGGVGKPRSRKRKLAVEDLPDKDSASVTSSYRPGGHGIHRSLSKKKAKAEENVQTGSDYKARKAGGDIKKKGRPDPFAYIPLNRTVLNKRKHVKSSGQFRNFVKGAKKGAAKGSKLRKKSS